MTYNTGLPVLLSQKLHFLSPIYPLFTLPIENGIIATNGTFVR